MNTGWTPTASVAGFGWKNISILSAGFQYKGINKLPFVLDTLIALIQLIMNLYFLIFLQQPSLKMPINLV